METGSRMGNSLKENIKNNIIVWNNLGFDIHLSLSLIVLWDKNLELDIQRESVHYVLTFRLVAMFKRHQWDFLVGGKNGIVIKCDWYNCRVTFDNFFSTTLFLDIYSDETLAKDNMSNRKADCTRLT